MKRLVLLALGLLIVLLGSSIDSLHAQIRTKPALPQVSVTFPGDTDETIRRRAQWIEGAKKEGALEWWGILTPAEANQVIAEFNKVYPFIALNYWRGKGEEIASKIEAEYASGRLSVDIKLGGEPQNYPRWRKMGMMEKFTDFIPGIKGIDKRLYSKYGDWAIPGNVAIIPSYNTKKISAAETPKNWEDLLDPKWKGQIGLTADMGVWIALAVEEGGWGIEKTEDFLQKLKQQQLIWASSHSGGHALMVAGEFKIMGEALIRHVFLSRDKGVPVDWVRTKPVTVIGTSFNFQKNAPHPHAARLFIEWLFSPHGLAIYEKVTGYGVASPGSGTRLAKALEGLTLVYRTEEGIIKAVDMDLEKRFAKILGVIPE